ncbi:MAG: SDR family oxidoreductase [Stellaceae bacterium]
MLVLTGGNGQLGRMVSGLVFDRIGPGFGVTTRDPAKATDLAARGISVRGGDYSDASAMERAFAGASTVLLISGDTPNEVRIGQHRNAIDAAKRAGARRIVYTSFLACQPDSPFPYAKVHRETETYLKDSDVAFTIMRDSYFAETIMMVVERALNTGRVCHAAGSGRVAWCGRRDSARALAAVLTSQGHEGKTYSLTGPATHTFAEVAWVLSAVMGREFPYEPVPPAQYAEHLRTTKPDVPSAVENWVNSAASMARGDFDLVTRDIADLIGTPPEDAMAFLRRELTAVRA